MYSAILAAIDVSVTDISRTIINRALPYLQHSDVELHLLSIVGSKADEAETDRVRAHLMTLTEELTHIEESRIHLHVSQGSPADTILQQATKLQAGLILIGAHRGDSNLLGRSVLGSTAAKIASQAMCDVCIVRMQ